VIFRTLLKSIMFNFWSIIVPCLIPVVPVVPVVPPVPAVSLVDCSTSGIRFGFVFMHLSPLFQEILSIYFVTFISRSSPLVRIACY